MQTDITNKIYSFNSVIVDTIARELSRDGKVIELQPRVLDLLIYLIENCERAIGKDELLENIWSGMVISESVLSRTVMKVRKAVGDDTSQQSVIRTLHGHGYRFVAELLNENAQEPHSTPIKNQVNAHASAGYVSKGGKRKWQLIAAFSAGVLVFFLIDGFWSGSKIFEQFAALIGFETDNVQTQGSKSIAQQFPSKSIAVLPFVNMSSDPEQEYFSDGIAEELLNLLTRVSELRVVARTSSFSLKGQNLEIPEIAKRLKVAHVLEGSVRKSGNRVRITAQLIKADDGYHLWSKSYDRTIEDIFAVQDEIARTVVVQLKATLLGDGSPAIEEINPEAYTLYLQARHLGYRGTPEATGQSVELFKQALVLEPDYAAAWAGLAKNYLDQYTQGQMSHRESTELARKASHRALANNADYAPAHAYLSRIEFTYDRNLKKAAQYLEHALALEPTNPDILNRATVLAYRLGRLDEAIEVGEFAVDRDPANPESHYYLGFSYLWAGHLDEAIASFRTTLMLSPQYTSAHYRIGVALLLKGDPQAALEEMLQEKFGGKRLEGETIAYHALGQTDKSDAALVELIDKYEHNSAYNIAYVMAFRGETDRAFEWLEKAVQYKDSGLTQIVNQPEFKNIHTDPRWLPVLKTVGVSPTQLEDFDFKVNLP